MKYIFNYIFIIALFLLISVNCKSPEPISFLPEPNPVSAEITLDATSSISETIGPEGGRIELAGTDGSNYGFIIPEGFLVSETKITMTPIASLTSPILEKFTAGVHFEPDGLVMPGVAWLEISSGVLANDLVGITYKGDGDEIALSWAEVDGSTIRVPITHFSGAGAGTPAPGGADRSPTNTMRAMGHALQAAYIDNDYECIDSNHPVGKLVVERYEALLKTTILPNLMTAAKNDLLLASAIRDYLEWLVWRQVWGESVLCEPIERFPEEDKAEQFINTGLENAIDTAADYCANTHDIGEVNHMLEWVSVSQLLANFLSEDSLLEINAIEHIKDCLTFELQFSSLIETTDGDNTGFSGTLNSTIEAIIPEFNAQLVGYSMDNANERSYGPLEYTPNLKYPPIPGCNAFITRIKTEPASAFLPRVDIPEPTRTVDTYLNIPDHEGTEQDDAGDKKTREVMMIFNPLKGSEFIEVTCSDLWGGPNPDGTFGTAFFNYMHKDTMHPIFEGFSIMMEVKGSGKLYAQKKFERTRYEDDIMITERTSFELFHKPREGQ